MTRIIPAVKTSTSSHLYYQKFAHKLSFSFEYTHYYTTWHQNNYGHDRYMAQSVIISKIYDLIEANINPKKRKDIRTRYDNLNLTYYTSDRELADKIIAMAHTLLEEGNKFNKTQLDLIPSMNINLSTMTTIQEQASSQDAKIVYRKSMFHDKYEWKMEATMLASEADTEGLELNILEPHEYEMVAKKQEGQNFSFGRYSRFEFECDYAKIRYTSKYGTAYITIFLKDETNVTAARLLLPAKTKFFRAVIA